MKVCLNPQNVEDSQKQRESGMGEEIMLIMTSLVRVGQNFYMDFPQ